jgi:hypothetical protein
MGDGWLCRDIGARKKARWLKRVKGGSAEIQYVWLWKRGTGG